MNKKVDILGTTYKVEIIKGELNYNLCGYMDDTSKTIKVVDERYRESDFPSDNPSVITKSTIRHEIIHAFLSESGLRNLSWAQDESIIDYFAEQMPKMYKVLKELEAI